MMEKSYDTKHTLPFGPKGLGIITVNGASSEGESSFVREGQNPAVCPLLKDCRSIATGTELGVGKDVHYKGGG